MFMSAAALLAAGTLFGTVTVGPTMPVCHSNVPCTRPAKDTLLTFSRDGRSVSTRTNSQGHYQVKLHTGTWSLHAGVGRKVTPTQLIVHVGLDHLNITIDTGIR